MACRARVVCNRADRIRFGIDLDGVESFLEKQLRGVICQICFHSQPFSRFGSIAGAGEHYGMGREDLAKYLDIIFSLNLEARSDEEIIKELQRCT